MDYGFVGDVDAINASLISTLLQKNLTPVFSPITHDQRGNLLNTNADTIAQELAKGLVNEFDVTLIYSFEKAGVLEDIDNEKSVIPLINKSSYHQLKSDGVIATGMIPKLDNAFAALNSGVGKVIIGKAEQVKDLIKGKTGTAIIHE